MFKDLFRKKKIELPKETIIVLGDSHSRSFSNNPNFFPFFVGAGKLNNFISDENLDNVKRSVKKVLAMFPDNPVILCFGEPDTRYALGRGWYPWKEDSSQEDIDYKKFIDSSVNRYMTLVDYLKGKFSNKILINNVTPSDRADQNVIVDYFNQGIASFCSRFEVPFLEINSTIYESDHQRVKEEYYLDHVHLDTAIQKVVEPILLEMRLIAEAQYDAKNKSSNLELQKQFSYNKQFGCYVLK